jgi:hypothetical protein
MTLFPRPAPKLLPLAGCPAHEAPAVVAVPYNPPSVALSAPTTDWHHVRFASNSAAIDRDGRRMVDAVDSDAANMCLSRHRATAVRNALLKTGKVAAARIGTRWTGQRQPDEAAPRDMAAAGNRMVDIGIH